MLGYVRVQPSLCRRRRPWWANGCARGRVAACACVLGAIMGTRSATCAWCRRDRHLLQIRRLKPYAVAFSPAFAPPTKNDPREARRSVKVIRNSRFRLRLPHYRPQTPRAQYLGGSLGLGRAPRPSAAGAARPHLVLLPHPPTGAAWPARPHAHPRRLRFLGRPHLPLEMQCVVWRECSQCN